MNIGDKVFVRQCDGMRMGKSGWVYKYKLSETPARIMAIAEGYAMLRFKNCVPFAKALKDLTDSNVDGSK